MVIALQKRLSIAFVAGAGLLALLATYAAVVFMRFADRLAVSSPPARHIAPLAGICTPHRELSVNPRPALFIGCGIIE